ncbi:MAG: hypothetical protein A2Y25_05360 [Candidatus Melainabacteria bacterium GWF2_37_15]|nr:MAG: hypothetical protein A2Y25_05360 [Candidatus Melainabacteria bacterium GWF2_37_15]
MISGLKFRNIPQVYTLPAIKTSALTAISFKGDTFSRSKSTLDRFIDGEIDPKYTKENSGTNGKVSIIKEEGREPVVIKFSHTEPFNPKTGLVQRVGVNFDKEASNLKLIPDSVKNSTKFIGMKSVNGVNYLVISYVEGKNPYANDAPEVTMQHIKSCMDDLFELDKAGLLHRDLLPENVLVTNDGKLNITDYGAGVTFKEMTKMQADPKYAHPENWLYSNINTFEELFVLPYCKFLTDKDKEEEAKKLFVEFLREKGDFHGKKTQPTDYPENQRKTEKIQAKIFSRIKPDNSEDKLTKDVTELEILRINIRMAQKISRLYNASGVMKNPLTSLYFHDWSGACAKQLINRSNTLEKDYEKDPAMINFLKTEKEYAEHNLKKVYKPVRKELRRLLDNADEQLISNIISEGLRAPIFNQVDGTKTNNNVRITTIYAPRKTGIFH